MIDSFVIVTVKFRLSFLPYIWNKHDFVQTSGRDELPLNVHRNGREMYLDNKGKVVSIKMKLLHEL